MSLSSSDSDKTTDDDFVIEVLQVLPRLRFSGDRSNPFTEYDDTDFIQRSGTFKILDLTIFTYYKY